jgi:aspartyl-tRNA synthetase
MGRVKEEHGDEIKDLYGIEVNIPSTPFPRISFREAKGMLKQSGKGSKDENDISSEEEKAIGDMAMEKYGSEFIFVKEYPWSIKPFYHMRKEDDPSVTKGYDLLYKGLEITTGAQREHRHDILMKQAKEKGLSEDNVRFYTDFFRYGAPPHGGFGFGLSRMVKQMLNIENIKEAMFAFRDMKRLFP